jgi:hypothetical protein
MIRFYLVNAFRERLQRRLERPCLSAEVSPSAGTRIQVAEWQIEKDEGTDW